MEDLARFGMAARGPVEKAAFGEGFTVVFVDTGGESFKQRDQIIFLFLEIFEIAGVVVPFAVDQDPPHGVGTDPVHPSGQGCFLADQIETGGNDVIGTEDGEDGHGFGVHIADPDQAIAFDTIPEVVLHVEMDGIGAGLPDLVEAVVIALEGTQVFERAVEEYGADGFELNKAVFVKQVDTDKTKASITYFAGTQPGNQTGLVTDGMVIGGIFWSSDIGHGFTDRFAKTDSEPDGFSFGWVGIFEVPDHDLDAAVEFFAEIEQDPGGLIGGLEGTGGMGIESDLAGPGNEQGVRVDYLAGSLGRSIRFEWA